MREIKFRAWNKKHKQMLYNAELTTVDIREKPELMEKCDGFEITTFFHIAPHDPNTVLMQYTGLKDKSGREIYESDILKHDLWGVDQVVWDDMCANFRCKREGEKAHDITLAHHQLKQTKAIGNIYENPELLK